MVGTVEPKKTPTTAFNARIEEHAENFSIKQRKRIHLCTEQSSTCSRSVFAWQ